MRHRRLKWIALSGLILTLTGYGAGRLHQRDLVTTCLTLTHSLNQLVSMYQEANTTMWKSLGIMARSEVGP